MNNMTYETKLIDIEKLEDDLWDARTHDTWKKEREEKHVEELAESIKNTGLIHPITVVKKPNGNYSIVAGRFRTEACKKLGIQKVQCQIYPSIDEAKIADVTISENINRLDLSWEEKLATSIRHFMIRNYKPEEIMYLCKKIHNYGTKGIDPKFLDALESCPYSANTMYQIMQTRLQLDLGVQKKANKVNLSLDKRIMLTNRILRKHPEIQKRIIDRIQGLSSKKARIIVNQYIRDLETGAIFKHQNEYLFDETLREKVDERIYFEKRSGEYFLEISEKIEDLMYLLTDHKRTQTETFYEPNHVEYSERHRIDIAKAMTRRELAKLENDMEVLRDALNSFLYLVHKENLGRE